MRNSLLRLHIVGLAHGGEGVARDEDGRTVFVRGACTGDTVLAQVTHSRTSFARADTREIEIPSPARVEPRCPYAGDCGGCQWQHVSYSVQCDAKRDAVEASLRRIAKIDAPQVQKTVPAPSTYGYRNRIELTPAPIGPLELGFHGKTGEHVPVGTCDLLPEALRQAPGSLKGALRYAQGTGDLAVERIGVRASLVGGTTAVDVWTRPGPFPRDVVGKTLADSIGADSVSRVLVRAGKDPRGVRGVEALVGPARWEERLGGFRFAVSPPSFFQVNTAQASVLVDLVLDELALSGTEKVLDAYCGVGTFTLPLAATGASILAAEASGSALRDLRRNLDSAGLHALVLGGDVARSVAEIGAVDCAVVDPPRTGLSQKALAAIVSCDPARIVYVSCDPATFARDAARLREAGYDLVGVTPIDLFPQTYHIESVGSFDRSHS